MKVNWHQDLKSCWNFDALSNSHNCWPAKRELNSDKTFRERVFQENNNKPNTRNLFLVLLILKCVQFRMHRILK